MPYSITTKDGITLQNIPDDIPPDHPDLKARVQKIRAEGSMESLKAPDGVYRLEVSGTSAPAKPPGNPSPFKGSIAGGAFMGLRDPIDAGAQILTRLLPDSVVQAGNRLNNQLVDWGVPGLTRLEGPNAVDRVVQGANAEYEASRKLAGRDGLDFARLVGNIANPVNRIIPMSGATSAGQVALRAGAQGAISGAAQPVLDTQDFASNKALQIGLGGAVGAGAGYGLDKLVTKLGNAWVNLRKQPVFNVMTDAGPAQSPEALLQASAQQAGIDLAQIPRSMMARLVTEADKALKTGKMPDFAAVLRQAEGKAVLGDDAGLMLGQATRDPQQFAAELDLRGIVGAGKPIAERLALQNTRLIDRVGTLGAKGAPDAYDAGAAAIKNLQEVDAKLSQQVTAAYNRFRNASGATVDVPLQPLAQRLGEVLDTFGRENLPAAVLARLESYGLGGTKQTKVFDLLEADKLIKVINANLDPLKAPQAAALGALRRGLNESIELANVQSQGASGPAADLLRQALGLAKQRFGLHEAVPGLEAAAKDMAGKQAFVQQYITARNVEPDTLAGLVKLMSPETLSALRGHVLADILEKAAPGAARGSDAAVFSQAGFNRALDAIGDRKLAMLFGQDGLAQLRQVGRVAEWVQKAPKGSAVNTSNTGAAVMNLLQGLAGKSDNPMLNRLTGLPGVNLVRDSLSKSLEEGAARNALAATIRPQRAQLSPEEINALRALLPNAGGALGAATASGLR